MDHKSIKTVMRTAKRCDKLSFEYALQKDNKVDKSQIILIPVSPSGLQQLNTFLSEQLFSFLFRYNPSFFTYPQHQQD